MDLSMSTKTSTHINDKDSVLQSLNDNNRATNVSSNALSGESWVAIGINKEYVPTADDVGCVLRVEVSATATNDGKLLAGPMISFTDHVLSTPRGPPSRSLLTIPSTVPISSAGARFRVISYNILAELYATKQAYPYCDTWSLSWPYRRVMIQQELEETQGDIICLQEVQADHYEQHLNPFMQALGYDGMYKQKSRESMGQYGKVDGCATFWRRTKFIMVENYSVEFNDCAREAAAALRLDDIECRKYMNRLSRDNIAQLFIFEVVNRATNTTGARRQMSHICVVNTHIYSNKTRPDVKLWQSIALMREVESVAVARDVAVLVCGDFNSEADSAVHEFMAGGALQQPHPELDESDNLGDEN
jgi:CCR4-NOT transcription complex subunit 6